MKYLALLGLIFTFSIAAADEQRYECVITSDINKSSLCEKFRGWTHMCQIYDKSYDGTGTPDFCSGRCLARTDIPDDCAIISVRPTTVPEAHENRINIQNPLPGMSDAAISWGKKNITCSEKPRYVQKGTVIDLGGEKKGWIERGLGRFRAAPNAPLMGGDRVVVPEGSTATLNLNATGTLKVSEKTKFLIPVNSQDRSNQCLRGSIQNSISNGVGGAWHWLKQTLQGEQYEIKVPTAVAGARG